MAKIILTFMFLFAFAAQAQMTEAHKSRRVSTFLNLNNDFRRLGRYEKLQNNNTKRYLQKKAQIAQNHRRAMYQIRMLGKKDKKKGGSSKCPKKEGDEWKNYAGKAPGEKCSKCQPAYKLQDYVDAVNKSRKGDATFQGSCKKIVLDPLVKKAKVPPAYKATIKGKPYKNCLMRNQIFRSGRKGAKKFQANIKATAAKKLQDLKPDPCMSYINYLHAKYMAKSKCISHTEAKGGKAADEKCDGAGVRVSWRKRSLEFGTFKTGTEIVGVIPSKFGFNPTLLTCIIGLDDADPKKTNRKALHSKKHNFFGIGTFKKGSSIYYSVSLTSHTICKKKAKILAKKKWCTQMGIDDAAFKTLDSDSKDAKKKKK